MKNLLIVATAILASQAFAGILPSEEKVLTIENDEELDEIELQEYQKKMQEWDEWLKNMDAGGAVNLNIYNQFHRKSKRFPGALLGVDMEVNEIGIFYIEENMTTPYHWAIKEPAPSPTADGKPGPMGDYMEYISHVFELVSTEYRPKPALPGHSGTGGMRVFAIRGRKPNEIEIPERVKEKIR